MRSSNQSTSADAKIIQARLSRVTSSYALLSELKPAAQVSRVLCYSDGRRPGRSTALVPGSIRRQFSTLTTRTVIGNDRFRA